MNYEPLLAKQRQNTYTINQSMRFPVNSRSISLGIYMYVYFSPVTPSLCLSLCRFVCISRTSCAVSVTDFTNGNRRDRKSKANSAEDRDSSTSLCETESEAEREDAADVDDSPEISR